jgi:hypothetical protein
MPLPMMCNLPLNFVNYDATACDANLQYSFCLIQFLFFRMNIVEGLFAYAYLLASLLRESVRLTIKF